MTLRPGVARYVNGLSRDEQAARRAAQRARTNFAEAVFDAKDEGATLPQISEWTGRTETELSDLLAEEALRVYNRRYNRERYAAVKSGEREPYHGHTEGVSMGCTCEACERRRREIKTGDRQAWVTQGLAPNDQRHGTTTGYSQYGCRCGDCTDAQRQKMRRRRAAMTEEQREEVRRKDRERKRRSITNQTQEGA